MRFGRKCPDGFLPVFSVRTEAEAKSLCVMACSLGADGHYYSDDMIREHVAGTRDLESFAKFGDRLAAFYWQIIRADDPDPDLHPESEGHEAPHRFVPQIRGIPNFEDEVFCARCGEHSSWHPPGD